MLAPESEGNRLNRGNSSAADSRKDQTQLPSSASQAVATPATSKGAAQTKEPSRPRELFEGFITTLRHNDTLNRRNAAGQPETFRERALKSQKLEKPLRQFLEDEKHAGSSHTQAITFILDRANKLEKRKPSINQSNPKRFVWEDTNAKLKAVATVTALLELLKEPAAQREPVIEALKAWAKPPSLAETIKGMFSPSPKLRICRFASSLLEDLNIKR
jgi:hypothetical protein